MSENINHRLYIYAILALFIFSTFACSSGSQLVKYESFVEKTFNSDIKKYPEWATEIGIYDNGDQLRDISPAFFKIEYERDKKGLKYLLKIDTTGWEIDDRLDYIMKVAQYRSSVLSYERDPWYKSRPDFYVENCKNAILRLLYRNPDPTPERLLLAFERIKKTPDFLERAGKNIDKYEIGPLIHSAKISNDLSNIIHETHTLLLQKCPEREKEISEIMFSLVGSLAFYELKLVGFSFEGKDEIKPLEINPLGRDYYNSILSDDFMIDVGSDSVFSIAESIFNKADSIMKQLKPEIIVDSLNLEDQNDLPEENWYSLISDYKDEIGNIKNYLENEQILNVPEKALELRIVKMPEWLRQTGINSNYYIAPAPLDSTESGIFYLFDPLSKYSHDDSSSRYLDEIKKDILNFILPGYHFRNYMTERNNSLSRKLKNNSMFNGWNLYMEDLLIDRGFWGDNNNNIYDFYKHLRMVALVSMLEIELHANGITIDSAYNFVLNKLGEDASSYSRENIYSVTIYSAHNTSVLMGYYLFHDMRERARAKEGDKFDLREFHNKVLSEGKIPPSLIARKYGWE